MDSSGMQALVDVHDVSKRRGTVLLISGLNRQPHDALERAGLIDLFGAENLLPTFEDAICRAKEIIAASEAAAAKKKDKEKS